MRLTPDRARVQIAATEPGAQITDNEFDRWLAAYEAEIRERIAQDIARAVGEGTASDIARGATR